MKFTAKTSSSSTLKLDSLSSLIGIRIGSNTKFNSRSFANSERRLPVATKDAAGVLPRARAGMPDNLILVGFPWLRVWLDSQSNGRIWSTDKRRLKPCKGV
ncbi:hypothetical protein F8388_017640 [Cannabis sativa]|uniref:Uncharacterized protein n=1 Tax=Cannabis sativa TaxID=3483 RepID=A0A7J6DQW2_CANSA|nr:hypothetical protein F8388_007394 [Cannabis sativa]KAF4350256.1 hypothetical protein F8388_017640 [Cannabis sativa]KAF4393281.1 hypothetical protein G4B88_002015 [Cannabis sativa]